MKIEYVPLIGFIVWGWRCHRSLTATNHARLTVAYLTTLAGLVALPLLIAILAGLR